MQEYIHGVHPVLELMRAGRRPVRRAWIAERDVGGGRLGALRTAFEKKQVTVTSANRETLRRLCGSAEHQGVVVETDGYPYVDIEALESMNRLVLLDNVEDPQNVGAVLRSALFFGWRGVLLSQRGVPGVYPSVVKASAGASEHLMINRDRSANRCLRWLHDHGYAVAVLDGAGTTTPESLASQGIARLALVLGGEHRGVGHYIRMNADYTVGIAGRGPVTSLNASVAAGIVLHRLAVLT